MYFNFRLWLVEAFVRINRWDLVEDVIGRIYQWKLDLTIHPPLLRAMMEALDWLIEPLYKGIVRAHKFHSAHDRLQPDSAMYSPDQPGLRQADSPRVLFEELPKLIKLLNVNIALNQSVFYRVTLVVKHYQREAPEIAQRLAGEVFMPALALIDNRNEQVTSNIWDVLAETEFSKRYDYYSKMITETYLQNVSLIQVLVQTQISLGKWSRRFSADNIKQVTRPLAKMVAGNGLVVFEHLVTMAKNNDNMIEPLSKAIETSHPLALDMFAYTIVRILSDLSPKEQKLDAESNVAQWLTNIAQMAGMFFKKYPQTDIVPLLRYLLNKMRKD